MQAFSKCLQVNSDTPLSNGVLEYYSVMDHYEAVKRWYDDDQFGNVEVYCPLDGLNDTGDMGIIIEVAMSSKFC